MEAALLTDETANFFFRDTILRLTRIAEVACGYWAFVLLLYCRFACPGGSEYWSWLEPGPLWVVVFTPLFLLDWRSFLHWRYLRAHHEQFSVQDGRRYLLICISETLFKVLLCLHLMFKSVRRYLTFRLVMFPYVFGYVLHFVLGHFVPLDDADRAEGCNMVANVLSDLFRFLAFILLVSLSLKIDSSGRSVYDWQAAFWPCWGLEGIILLGTALFLPVCLTSICVDRPKVLMLSWVILSGLSFGLASFLSVYSAVRLLDGHLCPRLPSPDSGDLTHCRRQLQRVFLPWLLFLPGFSLLTLLLRRPLAVALHEAWYQPAQANGGEPARGLGLAGPALVPALPPPPLLFRVTVTYYSRGCEAAQLAEARDSEEREQQREQRERSEQPQLRSTPAREVEAVSSGSGSGSGPATWPAAASSPPLALGSGSASASTGSLAQVAAASTPSAWALQSLGSAALRSSLDPSSSILSARGAAFADIVESEQLCFVCYAAPPDAVLLECGHAGLCSTCALHLLQRRPSAQCPICRSAIALVVRLRADLPLPSGLFVREPPPRSHLTEDTLASVHGPPWPTSAKRFAVVVEPAVLRGPARWWRN